MEDRIIKRCRICSSKALSFNFNGLCCESCKIFFRRNAFKLEQLKCYYKDDCNIDIETRTICKKCRLKKCFNIGMQKELILSKTKCEEITSKSSISNSPIISNVNEVTLFKLLSENNLTEKCNFSDEIDDKTKSCIIKSKLGTHELDCLELIRFENRLFAEKCRLKVNIEGYFEKLVDAFNNQRHYLPRIIKLTKQLTAFKAMALQDQLSLMRISFRHLMLLIGAYYFNFEKNSVPIATNDSCDTGRYIRLDMAYEPKLVEIHRKFAFRVQEVTDNDDTIKDLMFVLIIFRHDSNLKFSEYVRYQYILYCQLLRKYLHHKYGNLRRANETYIRVTQILQDMDELFVASFREVTNRFCVSNVTDILMEIYDFS